jgi:hypothetical protein
MRSVWPFDRGCKSARGWSDSEEVSLIKEKDGKGKTGGQLQ